jgi:SAM-dependent methyltransferase
VLTYFSTTAHADFWTEHWGGHSVEELLAVARGSPLTALITGALPPGAIVLEAGCGLGQYVILLRERGWRAAGVDGSLQALVACRRARAVPLAASDLRSLAVRTGALGGYVSLGVVEHDVEGPDAILAEAHRVLAPGGILVISVPYLNGARRLAGPWIRRGQAAIQRAGGAFYQYAFTRRELLAALRRQRFEPLAAAPYDPARLLRGALRAWRPAAVTAGPAAAAAAHGAVTARGAGVQGRLTRVARRVLYSEAALRLLGHMLLVVARRP